jgi:hypothetical protein
MKRILIGLGITAGILLFALLLRFGYLHDKHQEQLLYNICREQGCSDAQCQYFAQNSAAIRIECSNGRYVKRW